MQIFVSYSTQDDAAVQSLVRDLERTRHQIWVDQKLTIGEAWWTAILEQIRACTVFVFALSDNSLRSKPCRAEASYAEALGLPILPVQIGEVESYRIDPIFTMQLIDYREPTAQAGLALFGALQERAARRGNLPDPLPDPPPIPYEYLLLLGKAIDGEESLSYSQQSVILSQLRQAFLDEYDSGVRADIRKLLGDLRRRPEAAVATVREIDFLLQSDSEDPRIRTGGWLPDPSGKPGLLRYWDGTRWTEHVRDLAAGAAHSDQHSPKAPPTASSIDRPAAVTKSGGRSTAPGIPTAETAITTQSPTAPEEPATKTEPPSPQVDDLASFVPRIWERHRIVVIGVAILLIAASTIGITGYLVTQPSRHMNAGESVLPFTGLNNPTGVAVDTAGSVYVSDLNNRVLKLAAGLSNPTELPFTGIDFLLSPGGVVVDNKGNVYVSSEGMYGRVVELAAGSTTTTVWPFAGLYQPQGLAVDTAGSVYVSDSNNRVVKLAAGSNTQTMLPFNGLNYPEGVAVDGAGNVYVADRGNNRVVELAAGSNTQTDLPFDGLKNPDGVALDSAGSVYVTDTDNNRVLKLAAGSNTPSVLPFTGLHTPVGVAVDTAGAVYVADRGNNRVVKLSAASVAASAAVNCGGKKVLQASGSNAQKDAMDQFIYAYSHACSGYTLDYNADISDAGVSQFLSNQADLVASDSPLDPSNGEPAKAAQRCSSPAWDLPAMFAPIAVMYNVTGVSSLVLDGPTTAKIFNGTVTTWDDLAIKTLNPGVNLPSTRIHVVFRGDQSGTTDNFQHYLDVASNGAWGKGSGKTFNGGVGENAIGDYGAASALKKTDGSITYSPWSVAVGQELNMAQIVTSAGPDPVSITDDSIGKTIGGVTVKGQGNDLVLDTSSFYKPNQPGAYPIVQASYAIVCSKYPDPATGTAVKAFMRAAIGAGQDGLDQYGYGPLPSPIQSKVATAVNAIA